MYHDLQNLQELLHGFVVVLDVWCTMYFPLSWFFVADIPPGAATWLCGLSGGGGARTGHGEDHTTPWGPRSGLGGHMTKVKYMGHTTKVKYIGYIIKVKYRGKFIIILKFSKIGDYTTNLLNSFWQSKW